MNTKSMLSVTMGVAALTFSSLAAAVDMADAHCMGRFDSVQLGSTHVAEGYLLHTQRATADSTVDGLEIGIEVWVPNNLPGFDNLATAVRSTFVVALRLDNQVYAECTMNASPVITERGHLQFALGFEDTAATMKRRTGLCDIDPWTDGIQVGTPIILDGTVATIYSTFKGMRSMVSAVKFELL